MSQITPQYSPDHRWRWDGTSWQPATGSKFRGIAGVAALLLGLAAIMCVALIPMSLLFDPDVNAAGAVMSSLQVAVIDGALAFVVIAARRSRLGLIIVAVIAVGASLFVLAGAASMAANHPHAAAIVPALFWTIAATDAIAAVVTIVAAIRIPKHIPA